MSNCLENMNFNIKIQRLCLKCHHMTKLRFSTAKLPKHDLAKIRNIGISAHIDAGKTTTTERMLYYSGLIDHMGEVHHGNTVTDFMDQERERGITITSAAVSFFWKNHQFNLIDTPGHIDFTMEVEQTLNVLDGVVVILDGSAGVEAQTLTVWRQADRYNIPRIVYVNKMDRTDSNIHMCCESIEKKLDVSSILLQLPVVENNRLVGIIDVLSQELISYGSTTNKNISRTQLSKKEHPELFDKAQKARIKVIEQLSDFDDELANKVISLESFDSISTIEVVKALRNVTQERRAVPVLLGSSYKNLGVQTLMDSIILYLPSPESTTKVFSHFEDHFCGRAFKVKHDKQRGPLVFVRMYNGLIKKGQKVHSVQRGESEQVSRLYVAYADDYREVDQVENGNIAVLGGLKKTICGDLLTTSQSAYEKAKKNFLKKTSSQDSLEPQFGISARVPEPVFFCSIEPPSMATQNALDQALAELQREDPSLRVTYNSETAQTVLGGMGELHLEIIRERILREYKIDADLGPLQISYREEPLERLTEELRTDVKIGSIRNSVFVKLSIIPEEGVGGVSLKFDKSPESASNLSGLSRRNLTAIKQGIAVGLGQGPKISSPVINTTVMLHWFEVGRGTSDTIIVSTVTQLIQNLLKESGTCILEPVMLLEIVTPPEHLSAVMSDLSRRRSAINNVDMRGNSKVVSATTPLSELMGYSTDLRTITSGTAVFTTEFLQYQRMSPSDEENAIKSVRGF
ncbi:ribosome-releasing factor 2, mitochondrial [Anthonomus grandis grandis]|uniref:ribosome-releasing factor 2, mitochondrial n=1 Tax=Anthonomus grandis grandis TaxID=2921223 RepID=UPI002165B754|nr:ribosome-releasing factor 2, mitochondrial [Anthonomus grandis grandis]